ncbi:MAG: branched-chain amino acid ABC transporter permease [Alphaproteobacteria bacterium]|nr:branched-chain amino acid ABC transporter permease [Alphaproteobacteria bacterium]
MRFLFRTTYDQDIRLFQFTHQKAWYAVLLVALFTAPLWLHVVAGDNADYYISVLESLSGTALAGLGLMVLVGYTGQVSLGHAAFLGIGAYAEAVLLGYGVPFPLSLVLAALISGFVGVLVAIPALRLVGLYLAIATFAFLIIIQEVLARWESVTGGNNGLRVPDMVLFGHELSEDWQKYYVVLICTVLCFLAVINLLRSPTGRAMVAIRDSEIAAQSLGVNVARVKTFAFFLSAAITGLSGALFAHKASFLSPEAFGIIASLNLLVIVVVGGLGSLHGAVFGAIILVAVPQLLSIAKDHLPPAIAGTPGLEAGVFGLILVLTILFEPLGMYGRWMKIKFWFAMFPLYKRATFKRQKSYMKTERVH